MPDPLVTRVAERLDIEPQQTERVLRTLAQLIKKQSARDGRVRVPGLGVFHQFDGALSFEPDQHLADAVNDRYLGLKPVPVAPPPFRDDDDTEAPPVSPRHTPLEAPPPEPPPRPREDVAARDAETEPPVREPFVPEQKEEVAEPIALRRREPADEPSLRWAPPGALQSDAGKDDAPSEGTDAPSVAEEQEAAPPPSLPPAAPDMPPQPKKIKVERRKVTRKPARRRSIVPWLLIGLFVILAAFSAYYFLNVRNRAPETAEGTSRVEPGTPPVEAGGPQAATAEQTDSLESASPDTVIAGTVPAVVPTPPAATEPVPASRIDRAGGGFTLIVGSRTASAPAEEAAARFRTQLRDLDVPVDVLQGTTNGTTRYRIAVGQTPSIEEALALKTRLGDRLPQDAWVTRISPDS